MTRRSTDGCKILIALIISSFIFLTSLANAHQSISWPTPISFDLACRIGLGRNCPGPCPTHLLRKDQTPNSPTVTVRRGGILPVHILKNNHVGGFSRWSLVKVNDMYNKKKHTEGAFLFSCADVQVTYCTRENQERDCRVDRMNQFYRHYLRIPKVYPDGYYVLGWTWYGGAVSTGAHGAFGDYFDCVYVKVQGGPRWDSYQPIFEAGRTMTGRDGLCRATTNKLGHCFREPCPFGNRKTTLMKPEEFEGKEPAKILRKYFEEDSNKTTTNTSLPKEVSQKPNNKAAPVPEVNTSPKPKISTSPKPNIYGTSKPTHAPDSNVKPRQTYKPSNLARPTFNPTPSPTKGQNKNSVQADSQNSNVSSTPNSMIHFGEPHGSTVINKNQQEQIKSTSPTLSAVPTASTPKPDHKESKKISKQQLKQEKRLRRKAKLREKRQKKMRKVEKRKAKREAKRLRRKKIKEQKKLKKQKKRIEKRRKKEQKRARKLAKKEAKRRAKKEAKESFKRSLLSSQGMGNNRFYDNHSQEMKRISATEIRDAKSA